MARIPKRLPRDVNARAVAIARAAIDPDFENVDPRPFEAIAESKARASQGGQARAATLTAGQKHRIAKRAADARWKPKTS